MTYEEFVLLVRELRDAQKSYFRERTENWLEEAKRLEKRVDEELKKDPAQERLFE